jgi:hypothetical protein
MAIKCRHGRMHGVLGRAHRLGRNENEELHAECTNNGMGGQTIMVYEKLTCLIHLKPNKIFCQNTRPVISEDAQNKAIKYKRKAAAESGHRR